MPIPRPPATMNSNGSRNGDLTAASKLAELRQVLLSEERDRLERLEHREVSSEAVAEVLPDAILAREAKDDRVARALEATVKAGLFRSARNDPQELADAIHPALGPAIRSMIQASLRQSMESLNVALENSLSPKGIGWRLEAARTGKPFSEVVLLKTLAFRVDQVLLVDKDSGIIMSEVHAPGSESEDVDMVAGMLSAIRDFAADSFGATAEETPLEEIEFQGLTLILAQGPEAVLALVVRGNPPRALHERASEVVERLHVEYGAEMNDFEGESTAMAPLEPLLEELLEQESRRREPSKLMGALPKILAAALVLWMLVSGFRAYQARRDLGRIERAFEATPGFVLTDASLDDGKVVVQGLIDPLVRNPGRIVKAALGSSEREVDLRLRPFSSLDDPIVNQRVRQLTTLPAGVGLDLQAGKLYVSGLELSDCEAAAEAVRELPLQLLGIERVIVRR